MAWSGCCVDGRRFLGGGVTAYHRWWIGERSEAWKQKACPKHAGTLWNALFHAAIENTDELQELPSTCGNCGGSLAEAPNVSYHNFFQAKERRNLILVTCNDCFTLMQPCCMEGAAALIDRPGAGAGGSGGAGLDASNVLASLGRLP